jgi:nitronate monooxygenase
VQVGTAFLSTGESALSDVERRMLAAAESTVVTDRFTGRPARGVRNALADRLAGVEPLPFPLQAVATGPVTRAAVEQGREDLAVVLAGQGVSRGRAIGAAELVATLVRETDEVLRTLAG